MFTRIVAIIFVAIFGILVAGGSVIKPKPGIRFLEPILKCYGDGQNGNMGRPQSDDEIIKMVCQDMKEWDPCLADAIKAEPAPVPKVFNFFALTAYQTSYLYKRSNLCPKLTYGRVKKMTEDSGILKEEGLFNIADDHYENCVGDALKKCTVEEMRVNGEDDDKDEYVFFNCMKTEQKTCNPLIMRHFMDQMDAYKKRWKKLMELEQIEGLRYYDTR